MKLFAEAVLKSSILSSDATGDRFASVSVINCKASLISLIRDGFNKRRLTPSLIAF